MKALLLLLVCLPVLLPAGSVALVKNGESAFSIVLPEKWDAGGAEKIVLYKTDAKAQADRLADYIERSTGARLPVCSQAPGSRIEFVQAAPGTMDLEGFSFTFPTSDRIVITVGGTRALEFAVSEFLERYLGIRWVFPSELGTVIPKHSDLIVKSAPVKMQPSFLSRYLAGGNNTKKDVDDYYRWMLVNKGNFTERGGHAAHNLWRLVPPEKYGKTHPEFFPVLNGKRFIPAETINWQPCFTEPGVVNAVLENLPSGKQRVSLQVNDGDGFCECPRCQAVDGNRKNFIGVPNRSASYLRFCNAVAEKRPDVEFMISAYWSVTECPPEVRLAENIRYGIAYETFQWIDPVRFENTKRLMERWNRASSQQLSWYDYVYGGHYTIPRIFTRFLGNNLKWRYEHNVRYLTGEYYPRGKWDDSINIYVWLKLAWNIDADVEELIDDYCQGAVGEKAAPYLKEYFTAYEKVWTSPAMMKTDYFAKETTYFNVDHTFFEPFPDDFAARCEALLLTVLELSDSKERAMYFYRRFQEVKPYFL